MRSWLRFYMRFIGLANVLAPAMQFGIRLWMARVFFASGILKISDWQTTLTLFTYEHPVPFMTPVLAAVLGTSFELLCPFALVFGLFARLATLPLLAMTAVIQFTYLDHIQHYYWAMLLGMILFTGPGEWSLDYFISRKIPALDRKF